MSVLSKAIRACLSPVSEAEPGILSVQAVFPPGFEGFKGHFPGRPILPGVCLVQAGVVALGMARGAPLRLKRLGSAKWLAPVLPGESLSLTLAVRERAPAGLSAKVKVMRGADKVAEFSIEVGPV